MRFRPVVPSLALLLALLAPAALLRAASETITDPAKIKEVDFTGLSEAQKKVAIKILNDNSCNCGCEMTIAVCRLRDSSCRRSLIFARTVVDALREGKPEAEVVKMLKAKADTFVAAKLPEDDGTIYNIELGSAPIRGPKDAPVTIVEFSDFQCPYCAGLQATLDQVLKAFPKDVRIVFKQYPLNIHQYARQAAAAALAAHAQGKFWPMHDKLFANFSAITEENIKKWAKDVGLNMADFEKAMLSGKFEVLVQRDIADGAAAKVLGTPTLFINGKQIHDRSFDGFKKVIQEELASLKTAPPAAKKAAASAGARPSAGN
jgi:protein-disulfide isomerase